MSAPAETTLVLRLAGPLQSWGGDSRFNRRDTSPQPTKSGVTGLLAAAAGRRRDQDITDLLDLRLAVRVDQPGTLLRDYHTVSDYRGNPLPSAKVNAKGTQVATSPKKFTHVTERFYLQDAVFVAAVTGPADTIDMLKHALRHPAFPLALGRRSCPPSGNLIIGVYPVPVDEVLNTVPWQAGAHAKDRYKHRHGTPPTIDLPTTIEDPSGPDTLTDVPDSFSLHKRTFTPRRIRHGWASAPTGWAADTQPPGPDHDPFALLDW